MLLRNADYQNRYYIKTKYLARSKDTGHAINLVIYLKLNFWGTVVKCLPMEQQGLFDIKPKLVMLEMAFSEDSLVLAGMKMPPHSMILLPSKAVTGLVQQSAQRSPRHLHIFVPVQSAGVSSQVLICQHMNKLEGNLKHIPQELTNF